MSAPASKVMTAKISASVQSGDASSLLRISLMVGGAILLVLLLVFLYKKFVAKKPKNEYFEGGAQYKDEEEVSHQNSAETSHENTPENEEEFKHSHGS
jgi:hypothetical protein